MKIALSQMHVVPMEPEKNIETMLKVIKQAKKQNADLVVFPELCVSGYLLSDQWLNRQFCQDIMALHEQLLEASCSDVSDNACNEIQGNGIAIIFGSIYDCAFENDHQSQHENPLRAGFHPNKDGRSRLYNAAYVIQNGVYVARPQIASDILPSGVQPKTLLPNYRFFDDERYFYSLNDVAQDFSIDLPSLTQPFEIKTKSGSIKLGVQVCEDLWCKDYRSAGESINVSKHLIANGADAIINISASPWTFHKNDARDRRITFLKTEIEQADLEFVPFYYANNIGAQNNGKNIITFDGDTSAYNSKGELAGEVSKSFEEELLLIDHKAIDQQRLTRSNPNKIAQKYRAIITGLNHLPELLGWQNPPDFIVGLSGGVDSALVTALLTLAFGKDRVWTVNMPSQYNSDKTKSAAADISEKLGIRHLVVPIEKLVAENQSIFSELDNSCPSPEWMRKLSDENIQAKIRGTSILSNIAGRYGRMFTNNGNKVEIALGYATLYGDVGGVIAPIGDLTKTEVFDMVRYLNAEVFKDNVLPETLVPDELFRFGKDDIAPSAELRDTQIDPMKFGYHCKLLEACTSFKKVSAEQVMTWYLEGILAENLDLNPALISRWGVQDPKVFMDDLEWFYEGIRKSVFKRIQSPPIILTSPSAYGFDIRESQLPKWHGENYLKLKQKVLTLKGYPGES